CGAAAGERVEDGAVWLAAGLDASFGERHGHDGEVRLGEWCGRHIPYVAGVTSTLMRQPCPRMNSQSGSFVPFVVCFGEIARPHLAVSWGFPHRIEIEPVAARLAEHGYVLVAVAEPVRDGLWHRIGLMPDDVVAQ